MAKPRTFRGPPVLPTSTAPESGHQERCPQVFATKFTRILPETSLYITVLCHAHLVEEWRKLDRLCNYSLDESSDQQTEPQGTEQ